MSDATQITEDGHRVADTVDPNTTPTGPNPLNNPDVVEELVREFMTNVVAIRVAYIKDEIKPEEAPQKIDALSERMQGIFYGSDPEYSPLTTWNVPGALGQFICGRISLPEDDQPDAVRLLFHRLASDLLDILVATESGKADDERAQFETQGLIDSYRDILMGIQPGDEA